MLTELEGDSCAKPPPLAREKREEKLAEKHAREKRSFEQLEKLASFIEEAMAQFLAETSNKPIVELTLSSAEAPSKIVLRIDDCGRVRDITNDPVTSKSQEKQHENL